jgi:hypothetical protein
MSGRASLHRVSVFDAFGPKGFKIPKRAFSPLASGYFIKCDYIDVTMSVVPNSTENN